MTNYNLTLVLPQSFDVENFQDEFNAITEGEVCAQWDEEEDGLITLTIKGTTYDDELTNNFTCDQLDEMIENAKRHAIQTDGMFHTVILGHYTPTY